MGTDLHLMVQRRVVGVAGEIVVTGAAGVWELVVVRYPCPFCRDTPPPHGVCGKCANTKQAFGWQERVRKVWGQIIDEKDCTWPGLFPARGLPDDLRREVVERRRRGVRDAYDDYPYGTSNLAPGVELAHGRAEAIEHLRTLYEDAHNPWLGDYGRSWVTLAELDSYPLDLALEREGLVQGSTFELWNGRGSPGRWTHALNAPVWTPELYRQKRARGELDPETNYVQCSWNETALEHTWYFWTDFVPALRQLGAPEDVRIVMGFDS